MKKIFIRFYEELNDFLPEDKRKRRFEHVFKNNPSVKDLIESLGVPHAEIDLILVNGISFYFACKVNENDDISVYPEFESFDIGEVQHLRKKPLREKKFILDVHLGTLARYIRLLGFDALYENNYSDEQLIAYALREDRTILTKDRGILKRNSVTRGYFVRNTLPEKQLEEITDRFDLRSSIKEFSRCLDCNNLLEKADREKVDKLVPGKVKLFHNVYYYCGNCDKVYWNGSHYEKMRGLINRVLQKNR